MPVNRVEACAFYAFCVAVLTVVAARSSVAAAEEQATEVVVAGGNQALFRMAVAPVRGEQAVGKTVGDILSKDFSLSSIFQMLDPASFTANLESEVGTIDPASWRNVGAEGVVKGWASPSGPGTHLDLRLYLVSRGAEPVLKREYTLPGQDVRASVHAFANEVIQWFTGKPGSFGTKLVYSATLGPGKKGIFSIDSDGFGPNRLHAVSDVALAPAYGPGGIYYSAGLPNGDYRLFRVGSEEPVFRKHALVFGSAFFGSKVAVVVGQGRQTRIFVGGLGDEGLSPVTSMGISTHPAFGPRGELAYSSDESGSPQVYVDGKRITFRGTFNMAPAWCNDPEGPKLLFMGRDGGSWDIFRVDPDGSNLTRLTQNQGSNTYPACSPDGRMVAFFSSRGGLFLSNLQGQNQQRVANVMGESLRWQAR